MSIKETLGLFSLQADSLQRVPDGEFLAKMRLAVVSPFERQRSTLTLLVSTYRDGLFVYDGQKFKRFPTQVDSLLTGAAIVYHSAVLRDGSIALATLEEGVFF